MFALKFLILYLLLFLVKFVFSFSNITDTLELDVDSMQYLLKIGELLSSDIDSQLEETYDFNSILFDISPLRAFATLSGGLAQLPTSIVSHGICLWQNIYEDSYTLFPISHITIATIKYSILSDCDKALNDLLENSGFVEAPKERFTDVCEKTLSCIKYGNVPELVTELFNYDSEVADLRYPGGDLEKMNLLEKILNQNITNYNIIRCFLFLGDLRLLRKKMEIPHTDDFLSSDIELFKFILTASEESYSRGGSGGSVPIIKSCIMELLKISNESNFNLIEEMCSTTFSSISESLPKFSSMSLLKLYNDILEKGKVRQEGTSSLISDNNISVMRSEDQEISGLTSKNETFVLENEN